jgi:hypothetical protein
MSRSWPVVVAGALLLVSCGSEDDLGTTATTTSEPATTTTVAAGSSTTAGATSVVTGATTTPPSTLADRPKVGEVVAIVPSGGRADDELVAPGTELRRGALLIADPAGTVDFTLDRKIQRCQARPASQVRLVASDDALLEFVQGTVWCGTTAGGGSATFTVGGQVLTADDPVFSVTAGDDGQVEVRVIQGFLQVQDGPTLGEGQRGNRSGEGETWTVGPFGLGEMQSIDENDEGPVVQRLLDEVLSGLPPLSYPVPDVQRSPTLQRAADAGALRVLVVTDDGGPVDLVKELFGGLVADRWDVPVEVEVVEPEDALTQLQAGEAGIVVTPEAGGGYVPLFEDAQGQVWRALADDQDAELASALQGTIVTALQAFCEPDDSGRAPRSAPEQSCYDQIYSRTIGVDPVPLGPFAGLLGLG